MRKGSRRFVPVPVLASSIALGFAVSLAQAQATICIDPNASAAGLVTIRVKVLAADASRSVDGDSIFGENEADLRPEVSINGGPFQTGGYIEDEDNPHFDRTFEVQVPRLINPIPIRIRLRDNDAPDEDDWIDLDPAGGCNQDVDGDDPACTLELAFNTCCYSY